MARATPFLNMPFPSPLEEPFLQSMDFFFRDSDANLFSSVTDRNLFITGGGTLLFDSASETLSWTDPILLTNCVTGFFQQIPAGSVVLRDGEFLYTDQVRGLENITGTITLNKGVAAKLLTTPRQAFHLKTVICFRYGNVIIFRNGAILPADTPFPILVFAITGNVRAFTLTTFLTTYYPNENLFGTPDGVKTEFFACRNLLCDFYAIYLDGLRQTPGIDVQSLGPHIFQFSPPPAPETIFVLDHFEAGMLFQGVFHEANVWNSRPSGAINGVNRDFTILCQPHVLGTLRVYLDGMRMYPGTDYTVIDSVTFRMTSAPAPGMVLLVDYVANRTGASSFLPYFVWNETPTQIAPTIFETANNYVPTKLLVYLDGMRLKMGVDYTETLPNRFTLSIPPPPLFKLNVDYIKT